MNKITKALTALKCLQMAKAQEEVRGKEFTKVYTAFVNLFAGLFVEQTQFFLDYIASHEHIFTPDGGLIIEKSEEFGDMFPGDGFTGEMESFLIKAHMIGQDQTNKEVVGQADISLEVKNLGASLYAKNRAGELMKQVNDTTKDEVRTLFSKAWEENWSVSTVANAIEEKFTQFSKYRASLIATMEVANAYEVGKKDQFALYQSYYHFDGFKRSQTQHDSGVRYTHALNEIEGWIPEKQLFSGTETDHAPHGFNCRCVTLRSLLPPEVDDVVGVQFEKDSSSYIDQSQKLEISNAVQNFRMQAPYLPKMGMISDYSKADDLVVAKVALSKNSLIINHANWGDDLDISPEWGVAGSYSGLQQKNAIVYHELGHTLEEYIYQKSSTTEEFRGIPWAEIHDDMLQKQMSLLGKWQNGTIKGTQYPLSKVEAGYEYALRELFAESVSAYTMRKIDILDEDMKQFLDFLFLK